MRLLFLLLGGLHAPLVVEAMGLWAHEELNEMMMTGRPEHSAQLAVISLRAENEETIAGETRFMDLHEIKDWNCPKQPSSRNASPYESEVLQISGGVFVYGMGDYGEGGDSVHFFLIAVENGMEDAARAQD
ncbi:hypothetical protein RB195_007935 [Necator americanus]|uniref:Uncharacterized protein n=1 Tax=Necator americanus TaxID=51031 RepID=A0ABR1BZM6_NECAM